MRILRVAIGVVKDSCKAHLDWEAYRLPAPYGNNMAGEITCLMVLSLFAAFPELTSIPAFNKGGKGWTHIKHALSEIGVGNCHDGVGSTYCLLSYLRAPDCIELDKGVGGQVRE